MSRFDALKSRLGFGDEDRGTARRRPLSDSYDQYDDAYDDFDEYEDAPRAGWDTTESRNSSDQGRRQSSRPASFAEDYGDYNEEFAEYGPDYDENAPAGRFQPIVTSRAAGGTHPSLVTMSDVKMSTPLPEIPPIEPEEVETTRYSTRTVVDNTAPAPYSPAHRAASAENRSRNDGLDSLFGSATTASDVSAASPLAGRRNLKVVKPVSYGDAEQVARGLKAGDVVVLATRNTPDNLRGRILDFAFGAASALDANVECPGEKVFAIARGRALDDAELQRLRDQGVI